MSIAVIKGKVSQSGAEDLLTASVFGPLRYLPYSEYLKPILKFSRTIGGDHLKVPDVADIQNLRFWPTQYRREPDMEFETDTMKIFIEVKFNSGKSGTGKHDQLANQYEDLSKSTDKEKAVIYLTKHRTIPLADLHASIDSISDAYPNLKTTFRKDLFWISWYQIWQFLQQKVNEEKNEQYKLIVNDILDVLIKQRLKHFTGFTALHTTDSLNGIIAKPVFYEHRPR